MRDWLVGLGIAAGCLVASWGVLFLLARRLPPGVLRDLAAFIPDCLTTVRRLRKNPQVPRKAKIAVLIAGLWVASPIDLIPEFLPVIGPLDDIVVVALALRYAGRQVPRDVLLAAWPGQPRLLERLLGPAHTSPPDSADAAAGNGPTEVELLVTPDCPHQGPAAVLLRQALNDIGLTSTRITTTAVTDQRHAEELGFAGSPTIRIAGRDLFAQPSHAPTLACRIYHTPTGLAATPDLSELRQALRRASGR
ncbi:protein of unknown function DUF1232 [Parafrankia sp. EAN1pec]|nr:protein of unknown function DUF1232 [Frankia sp. EAN1pec]